MSQDRHRNFAWGGILLLLALSAVQFLWQIPTLYGWPKWDFAAYYHAASLVRSGQAATLYSYVVPDFRALGYLHDVSPYLYPPPVAFLLTPLTLLSYRAAFTFWFVLQLGLLAHVVWLLLRFDPERRVPDRWLTALFLLAVLNYGPLLGELCLGNINTLVLWLSLSAFYLAVRRRDILAGALLSAAFLIKLTPAVLLVYFLAERRWRVLIAFTVTSALLVLVTLGALGPEPFQGFFRKFGELSKGTGYSSNVSINGFLHRLLQDTSETIAPLQEPELILPLARLLGLLVLAVSILAVWRRRRDPLYAFAVLACAVSIASPITWAGHLLILLPALYWLMRHYAERIKLDASPGRAVTALAAGALLVLLLLMPLNAITSRPVSGWGPILWISRSLYGVLVLWLALLWEGRRL